MFWGASEEFLLLCVNIQTLFFFFGCNLLLEISLYSFEYIWVP